MAVLEFAMGLPLSAFIAVEIGAGSPWVLFGYPYPYPSIPLPLHKGTGFCRVRVRVPGGWRVYNTLAGMHKGAPSLLTPP